MSSLAWKVECGAVESDAVPRKCCSLLHVMHTGEAAGMQM